MIPKNPGGISPRAEDNPTPRGGKLYRKERFFRHNKKGYNPIENKGGW